VLISIYNAGSQKSVGWCDDDDELDDNDDDDDDDNDDDWMMVRLDGSTKFCVWPTQNFV
jgi:hypothetical protein